MWVESSFKGWHHLPQPKESKAKSARETLGWNHFVVRHEFIGCVFKKPNESFWLVACSYWLHRLPAFGLLDIIKNGDDFQIFQKKTSDLSHSFVQTIPLRLSCISKKKKKNNLSIRILIVLVDDQFRDVIAHFEGENEWGRWGSEPSRTNKNWFRLLNSKMDSPSHQLHIQLHSDLIHIFDWSELVGGNIEECLLNVTVVRLPTSRMMISVRFPLFSMHLLPQVSKQKKIWGGQPIVLYHYCRWRFFLIWQPSRNFLPIQSRAPSHQSSRERWSLTL